MDKNNITDSLTEKQKNAFNDIVSVSAPDSSEEKKTDTAKGEEFDIADFIVKHSTQYNVKKSKAPRIIAIVVVALMVIALCVVAAILSGNSNNNSIYGKWISDKGIEMEIIDGYITIEGETRKFIFPENESNVIAINVKDDYFRMLYQLKDGKLHIIIPISDEETETIIYTRKKEQ